MMNLMKVVTRYTSSTVIQQHLHWQECPVARTDSCSQDTLGCHRAMEVQECEEKTSEAELDVDMAVKLWSKPS